MRLSATAPKSSAASDATQTWLSVVRAYNLCDAVMSQRLAELGLRVPEHEVLANLLRQPGITQQQLAERCFVAKSGISMLVTRMAQAGLVQREADPGDARVRCLSLTAAGLALAMQTQKIQNQVVAAMAAQVSPAELQLIASAMQRTCVALAQLRQDAD